MRSTLLIFLLSMTFQSPVGLHAQTCTGNVYLDSQTAVDTLHCVEITGHLTIIGAITNLNGLSSLETVGGTLLIAGLSAENLDGLQSLARVDGELQIQHSLLENLDGLSNLRSVGGNIRLHECPNLTRCCGLYPLLNSGTFEGNVTIFYTGAGCQTTQEILDGGPCFISVESFEWGVVKALFR